MHRDALRRMLEDKGILMQDWPPVRPSQLLVMDEWGCNALLFPGFAPRSRLAVEAWADEIERKGGWSGDPYPNGARVYVIEWSGKVTAHTLFTEWEPTFYTRNGELPLPKGVVWC